MHKKIAILIKRIVDECPYQHIMCDIIPNPKSDGFWKCCIKFSSRKDAHSESLVRLLQPLGMVYGEGLGISDKGEIVEVS